MFFYYDTEKNIYPTQLEAFAAQQSGKEVYFYFYDKEFLAVDWKTEPVESLKELYKQRAQKLRDEYEYVIICYSGGIDSSNILETFYYNNIHIDEIVMVGAFSQDSYSGSDENHNGDVYHNAKPSLNNYKLPNTKISVYDYTELFKDPNNFTLIKTYGNEWTKHIGAWKSVHNLWWYDFKKFAGKNNENKKTCWIMGAEKPGFVPLPKPHLRFSDLGINDYGANFVDENFTRIRFYTDIDPAAVKIMRKQNHILKNFYDTLTPEKTILVAPHFKKIMETLIYDLKHPIIHKSKKSVTTSISARDMFMLNNKNSDMYSMFLEGLKTIEKYAPANKKINFFSRSYQLQ